MLKRNHVTLIFLLSSCLHGQNVVTDWAKIVQPAVNTPPKAPDRGARLALVSVCVRPGSSDRALRVPRAEKLASTIFERAGVQIEWQSGLRKSDRAKPAILIEITSEAPVSFRRGALAYALPFEGEHIRIFWDRLVAVSNDWILTSLLAHVMVHETTHVLQGTAHHSRQGIMKAC
jgi:hypothetical protein